MKYRELEYSRNFNLGNYESERITLKVDLDETEDLDESYRTLKATVFRLQKEGGLIEGSKKVRFGIGADWLQLCTQIRKRSHTEKIKER